MINKDDIIDKFSTIICGYIVWYFIFLGAFGLSAYGQNIHWFFKIGIAILLYVVGIIISIKVISYIKRAYKIKPEHLIKLTDTLGIFKINDYMPDFKYDPAYLDTLTTKGNIQYENTYGHRGIKRNDFLYCMFENRTSAWIDSLQYSKVESSKPEELKLALKFHLFYDVDTQSLKFRNDYPSLFIESLNIDEAFSHFYEYLNTVKLFFNNSNDINSFLEKSTYELTLHYGVKRNLFTKDSIDPSPFIVISMEYKENIETTNLNVLKDIFTNEMKYNYCYKANSHYTMFSPFIELYKKFNVVEISIYEEENLEMLDKFKSIHLSKK